jgi:superfamily II DNA or RNA helicase
MHRPILYPFQKAAMSAWAHSNCKGLLAMATGSGKTTVALRAISELIPESILVVVVVPSLELIAQWTRFVSSEFPDARVIECYSGSNWRERLSRIIDYFSEVRTGSIGRTIVVSTYHTARTQIFRSLFSPIGSRICLIADEAHHSGASESRHVLDIDARYRLGLSATPTREWDEEGSDAIDDYFGGTVFSYDIGEAIRDEILSPYEYFVHPVILNRSESEAFEEFSVRIASTLSEILRNHPSLRGIPLWGILGRLSASGKGRTLANLLYRRASIVKNAKGKLVALETLVEDQKNFGRCLVYCNDFTQTEDATRRIIRRGYTAMQYTSKLTREARVKALESLEHGACNFLVAIRCLDEGVDLPVCDSAIILASSKSKREFIQRRGRLLRRHPSKKLSSIHDMMVVPNLEIIRGAGEVELSILESELERAEVLAAHASNRDECKAALRDLRLSFIG